MPVDWHRALVHQLPMRGVPGRHTQWKDVPGIGTVPASWEVVRLGNVAEVAFSSVDKKTVDGEIPVELCNYTDVFYNRRIRPGMEFMTATASPVERRRWALRKGDVLFTKDSETPDEIGIPAYVTADMPKVLCGYHLGLARPRAELADGAYLAELLRSPRTARQFARIANGVTRFGLTLGATSSLKILLPPLPEQRAIAAVLDAIDDTIELTEAVIAATKELRRALLHELLTRGVPGWHSEWRDVPGIGTVPACWDVVRLGDVATLQRGGGLTNTRSGTGFGAGLRFKWDSGYTRSGIASRPRRYHRTKRFYRCCLLLDRPLLAVEYYAVRARLPWQQRSFHLLPSLPT